MGKKIFVDTSEFFDIDHGDEIHVENKKFKVTGHAKEMRFGIEDPKYWVKKAIDIDTGERKYIKLAFFESFETQLAGLKITCFRDPDKEGKVLDLTKDHPLFMHGKVYKDAKGNNVRVLDVVHGMNLLFYIDSLKVSYDDYFKKFLPVILKDLVNLFDAVRFLHLNNLAHGDIRNDHVIKEKKTGNLVWIDFDYNFETSENPFSLDIFGLGNILNYTIGKGFHSYYNLKNDKYFYKDLIDRVSVEDFSLLEKRRLINLRKLYPQIPHTLNNILMHFSNGTDITYESVDEVIEDMNRCLEAFQ
ncbi:MAG: protein kinase [Desulfobacteraceae bacterium]|nr:protein kinase [Desulfobacteraceae bacterium]